MFLWVYLPQAEKEVEKTKSPRKINAMESKLAKRKEKQDYYKSHIDNNTIPKVIFGGRKNFIKRCKNQITNEEWKELRDNNYYSRGDKSKKGNPNLRIIIKNSMTFLEISTLNKDEKNWAIKIQVPLYLPQKLSKKTGKINGNNYRQKVLDYLETGEAYQVELIRKQGKIHVHITIDEGKIKEYREIHTIENGVIGIDTNPDGFALTRLDRELNYKWSRYLKEYELVYARSNRRDNLCGELAKRLIEIAKNEKLPKLLKDKLLKEEEKEELSKSNNWKQWSIISKKIKNKGGEVPGLWQRYRKDILGIA